MVIREGFEPSAIRLKVECSTTELPDQGMVGKVGFEPTPFLMCRIYSPVPVRRPSSFPKLGGPRRT